MKFHYSTTVHKSVAQNDICIFIHQILIITHASWMRAIPVSKVTSPGKWSRPCLKRFRAVMGWSNRWYTCAQRKEKGKALVSIFCLHSINELNRINFVPSQGRGKYLQTLDDWGLIWIVSQLHDTNQAYKYKHQSSNQSIITVSACNIRTNLIFSM